MEEPVRRLTVGMLDAVRECLDQDYRTVSQIVVDITRVSRALGSKSGVLVGEVLESVFAQLFYEFKTHELDPKQTDMELSKIRPFLDDLIEAIKSGDDGKVYASLAEIRFYTTQQQIEFSTKYKRSEIARRRLIR